jgi:hypothetical protein
MGGQAFTGGLALGGFLLASWVDAKVGDARPDSPKKRFVHAAVGLLLLEGSVGLLYLVDGAGASQPLFLVAVLALFLPALVYAVLAALWLLRMLAEFAHSAGR